MEDQNPAQRAFAESSRIDFRIQGDNNPQYAEEEEIEQNGLAIYNTSVVYSGQEDNNLNRKNIQGLRRSRSGQRLRMEEEMVQRSDFDGKIRGNVQTPMETTERSERLYSKQPNKGNRMKRTITTEYSNPIKEKKPRKIVLKKVLGSIRSTLFLGLAGFLLIIVILVCYLLIPRDLKMIVNPPQKDSDNYGITVENGLLSVNTSSIVSLIIKNNNFYPVSIASVDLKFTWILGSTQKIQDFTEATTSDMETTVPKRSAQNVNVPLFFVYSGDITKDPLLQDFLQRCHSGNKGLDLEYVAEFQVSHIFSARKKQQVKTKALLPCPMNPRQISDTLAELNLSI
jgi:hypothetical protein